MPKRRTSVTLMLGALLLCALLPLVALARPAAERQGQPVPKPGENACGLGVSCPCPAQGREGEADHPLQTEPAPACTGGGCAIQTPSATMHIADLRGELRTDPAGSYLLEAYILVHDQDHRLLGEVEVGASIWWPNGGPVHRTRMTRNANGLARFPWGSNVAGHWKLCVDTLVKEGYLYDPDAGEVPACAEWNN